MVPICCVILGYVLNLQAAKRANESIQRQTEIAAEVARHLKAATPTPMRSVGQP
jgi:hypothetical protein